MFERHGQKQKSLTSCEKEECTFHTHFQCKLRCNCCKTKIISVGSSDGDKDTWMVLLG